MRERNEHNELLNIIKTECEEIEIKIQSKRDELIRLDESIKEYHRKLAELIEKMNPTWKELYEEL